VPLPFFVVPESNGEGRSKDLAGNKARVSVREWMVNYGRYCPPVNNSPPHYMWELLTLDRLDGATPHLSLSLSFFLSLFASMYAIQ